MQALLYRFGIYKNYSHIIGKEEKRMIKIADNVHEL